MRPRPWVRSLVLRTRKPPVSSARALRLWRWASLPRVWRLARAPGAVRTPGPWNEAPPVEGPVLGGAETDQEAVGDEHHYLAPREGGEALHDPEDRLQRPTGPLHDLEDHPPGLGVHLLARPDLAQVVLRLQDLPHGDVQGLW